MMPMLYPWHRAWVPVSGPVGKHMDEGLEGSGLGLSAIEAGHSGTARPIPGAQTHCRQPPVCRTLRRGMANFVHRGRKETGGKTAPGADEAVAIISGSDVSTQLRQPLHALARHPTGY